MPTLAVVGAGPKGIAIAAKARALEAAGLEAPLHLPVLAGLAQGQGFPNLSCLGLLSDRILRRYVAPDEPARSTHEGRALERRERV